MRQHNFLRFLLVGVFVSVFFNIGLLFGVAATKVKKASAATAKETIAEKDVKAATLAVDKAAREKAAKEKAEKTVAEKAAKAAKLAADKAAKEKAAKDKAAKEKAERVSTAKVTTTKEKTVAEKAAKVVRPASDKAEKDKASKPGAEKSTEKKEESPSVTRTKAVPPTDLSNTYRLKYGTKFVSFDVAKNVLSFSQKAVDAYRFGLIPAQELQERTGGVTNVIVWIHPSKHNMVCLANEKGKLVFHDYIPGSPVTETEGWDQMTGLRYPDTNLRNQGMTLTIEPFVESLDVKTMVDQSLLINLLQNFAKDPSKISKSDLMSLSESFKKMIAGSVKFDAVGLEKIVAVLKTLVENKKQANVARVLEIVSKQAENLLTPEQLAIVKSIITSVIPVPMPGPTPAPIAGLTQEVQEKLVELRKHAKLCKLSLPGELDKYLQMADMGMKLPVLLRIPEMDKATDFRVISIPLGADGYEKYSVEFDALGKSWRIRGTDVESSAFDVVSSDTPFDEKLDVWGHVVVPADMDKLHNGTKTLVMVDVRPQLLSSAQVSTVGPKQSFRKKPTESKKDSKIYKLSLPDELDKCIQMADMGMGSPVLLRISNVDNATDFRVISIPLETTGYAKYSVEFDALGKSWRIRGTDVETSAFDVVPADAPFDDKLDVWGHVVVPGDMDKLHNGTKTLVMVDVQSQPVPLSGGAIEIGTAGGTVGTATNPTYARTTDSSVWCLPKFKASGKYLTYGRMIPEQDLSTVVEGDSSDSAYKLELVRLERSPSIDGVNYYEIVNRNGSIGSFSLQRDATHSLVFKRSKYKINEGVVWQEAVVAGGASNELRNGDIILTYETVAAPAPFVLPAPKEPFEITLASVANLFDQSSIDKTIENIVAFYTNVLMISFTNYEGGLSDFVVRLKQFFVDNAEKFSDQQKGKLLEFLPKISLLFGGDEQVMITDVISKLSQVSPSLPVATQTGGDLVL